MAAVAFLGRVETQEREREHLRVKRRRLSNETEVCFPYGCLRRPLHRLLHTFQGMRASVKTMRCAGHDHASMGDAVVGDGGWNGKEGAWDHVDLLLLCSLHLESDPDDDHKVHLRNARADSEGMLNVLKCPSVHSVAPGIRPDGSDP